MAAEAAWMAYDSIRPLRLCIHLDTERGLRARESLALLLHRDRLLKRTFQYIELFVV
jgi:hypothetical protein